MHLEKSIKEIELNKKADILSLANILIKKFKYNIVFEKWLDIGHEATYIDTKLTSMTSRYFNNITYLKEINTIFSEIFYPKGWKAYINDQEVTMERFNYILRGLEVPKGKHRLEFVFDPTIVKLSSNISLFSTLGFMFIILVMILKRKN